MRELERSLSKVALLPAPPDNRGRASGSARKKFNHMQLAVGWFIGKNILRALLTLAEPNTCANLVQLSIAAKERLIEDTKRRTADIRALLP